MFSPFRIFEQLALALENRVFPENFHCIEYTFTFRIFEQLALPCKTECALNSLYGICIFYHSENLSSLLLSWKQSLKFFKPGADVHLLVRLWYHVRVIREDFCDGLEIKFISPLGWIQQAGASETAAKSATPCFTVLSVSDSKSLGTSLYFISTNFHTEL